VHKRFGGKKERRGHQEEGREMGVEGRSVKRREGVSVSYQFRGNLDLCGGERRQPRRKKRKRGNLAKRNHEGRSRRK